MPFLAGPRRLANRAVKAEFSAFIGSGARPEFTPMVSVGALRAGLRSGDH